MSRNQTRNDARDERPGGSGFAGSPCCPEGVSWPGPRGDIGQMMQSCPCTGWLRRHRVAVYTALTVIGLGFLALQVGWILGVIAFFRTL